MGGLAAGAWIAGRLSSRIRRPVLLYGILELGIAVSALAIPFAIQGSRTLYVSLFGGSQGIVGAGGATTALFYLVCSFLILLVPTSMMGATLPLLARHAIRSEEEIGRRIGVLYGVNTAGAVVGTLLAAFVLVPALGLRLTIWAAAGINALVFGVAWLLARRVPTLEPSPAGSAAGTRLHPILLLILVSGAVSFSYEILWSRLLAHVVGSSMYAFATMLGSFLIGIALGSAAASGVATDRRRAARGFAVVQLGIAALSLAAYAGVEGIPELTHRLQDSGVPDRLTHAVAGMFTLFPAAVCIGATFPFAVRVLATGAEDAAVATARVYTANTVGAIVGSIAAGFLLVPALGYGGTLALCVALNLILAALAALLLGHRAPLLAGTAVAGLGLLALLPPGTPWRVITTTTVGRTPDAGAIEFYRVGRAATVLLLDETTHWQLRTNGLPESSILPPEGWQARWVTARWLTGLPVLTRPDTRSMLIVGLGGGVAVESVPETVERIDVVELEPEVIAANRAVGTRRWRDPLQDPRVRVHANDARNALLLSGERFDAIVSQPSHPWSPGAALLYTQEFFEIARDHLSPDGVLVQWMGLQFIDVELFAAILATLTPVFEHVRVYSPPPGAAVLFVASNAPLEPERTAARALAATPEAFQPLGLWLPEHVTAALRLDEEGSRAVAAGAEPIRDDDNLLQARAGRVEAPDDPWLLGLAEYDPLARALPPETEPFALLESIPPKRARRVAEILSEPSDRAAARGQVALAERKPVRARKELEAALAEDPRHPRARAMLLGMSRRKLLEGTPPESILAPPLYEAERAMVEVWGREPSAARELEAELAAIDLGQPLAREARWARAEWRIRSGDPSLALEAVQLADEILGNHRWPQVLVLRARALAAAGQHAAALHNLIFAADQKRGEAPPPGWLATFRAIPEHPETATLRERALQSFQAGRARRQRPAG